MTPKPINAIVRFEEDKPLIHYGLIRFSSCVIQLFTQIINNKELLMTCIIKNSITGRKSHSKYTTLKKENYWLTIERAFLSLRFLNERLYMEKPETVVKDFRNSTWDDILEFFQTSDQFDTWIENNAMS